MATTARQAFAAVVRNSESYKEDVKRMAAEKRQQQKEADQAFLSSLQTPTTVAEMNTLVEMMPSASKKVQKALCQMFASLRNEEGFIVLETTQYFTTEDGYVMYSQPVPQQEETQEPEQTIDSEQVASVASSLNIPEQEVAKIAPFAQEVRDEKQADRETYQAEARLETVNYQEELTDEQRNAILAQRRAESAEYLEQIDRETQAYIVEEIARSQVQRQEEVQHMEKQEQEREVICVEKRSTFAVGTIFTYYHPECYQGPIITVDMELTTLAHTHVGDGIKCCLCGESVHVAPSQIEQTGQSKPQAYRHTFDGVHIFYYHHACVVDRLPEEVTFDQIALEDVPQKAECEYCYKPMHKQETKTPEQSESINLNELRQLVYTAEASLQSALETLEPVHKDHVLQSVIASIRSAINDLDDMREKLPEQSEIMIYIEKAVAKAFVDDGDTPAGIYVDEKYKEELQDKITVNAWDSTIEVQGQNVDIVFQSAEEMDGELVTVFHDNE